MSRDIICLLFMTNNATEEKEAPHSGQLCQDRVHLLVASRNGLLNIGIISDKYKHTFSSFNRISSISGVENTVQRFTSPPSVCSVGCLEHTAVCL